MAQHSTIKNIEQRVAFIEDVLSSAAAGTLDIEVPIDMDEIDLLTSVEIGINMLISDLGEELIRNKEKNESLNETISELEKTEAEREALQKKIIESQKQMIQELSIPVIPLMNRILLVPLVGTVDRERTQMIMRNLLAQIKSHRAKVVILDLTGISAAEEETVNGLNRTIQAARLKGAHTIVTGLSDDLAQSVAEQGYDWSKMQNLRDLHHGLSVALDRLGYTISMKEPSADH